MLLNKNQMDKFMNQLMEGRPQMTQQGLSEEDQKLTQRLLAELDEIEALQEAAATVEEATAEVLLDSVCYNEKPATDKTITAITKRLPQSKQTITLEDLAQAVASGRSWKASVLSDTTNNSFVSSSLVALDIDNEKSYTSIADFMALDHKYKPCFIYETFSSVSERERFRVVYAFDSVITDYDHMCAIYEEVQAQLPTVEFDKSVHPGKILFGGKALCYFESIINETPSVETINKAPRTTTNSNIKEISYDSIDIDKDTVLDNLSAIAEQYAYVQEIDINEAYKWINANVKMTDVLGIQENTRFRCILPNHEDKNPSARITTDGEEQIYFCTCEASGYRLISLLSKLLDISEVKVKAMILNALNISFGSEYQKATERYIADLRRNINKVMPQDLLDYLQKRKLYRAYRLIIDFADAHITYSSLSNNNDKVVFFLSKRHLKEEMEQSFISGNAGEKLTALCELGFLRKLTDSEIRRDALSKAHKQQSASKKLNRVDFYELIDLSPSVISDIQTKVNLIKDSYVRQRGNNVNRRINTFGEDEVTNNINVQTKVDTKKQNKVQTKLRNVLIELLDNNNNLFNESDLAKAYRNTDKKHIRKADAEQIVLDYIPTFKQEGLITRIRINKDTRKQYNIPEQYKSNSFIYIKAC
jgi:hypothetical protein